MMLIQLTGCDEEKELKTMEVHFNLLNWVFMRRTIGYSRKTRPNYGYSSCAVIVGTTWMNENAERVQIYYTVTKIMFFVPNLDLKTFNFLECRNLQPDPMKKRNKRKTKMEREIMRRPATYMLPRETIVYKIVTDLFPPSNPRISYCFFCNINPVQVPHRHTHIMYITPVCLNQESNDCYLLNKQFLEGHRLVLIIDTRHTEDHFSYVVMESDTEFATIPLHPRSTNYLELVKMPTVATHFASEYEPSGLDFEIAVELNGEGPRMVNLSGDPTTIRRLQTNRSMLIMTYWKKAPPY